MADKTGPLPQEAIDFLQAKKLKPGFDYRDVWREEHAGAFTVAKMGQLDMLSDMRDSLVEALAKGKTYRSWAKQVTPELQKRGWWGVQEALDPLTGEKALVQLGSPRRLQTIYEANLRTSRQAGQWERIRRTATTHPYLLYQLGPSARHRPQHVAWAGTLLPIEDEFWRYAMPPNGWGCKCWIRQIAKMEYARLRDKGYQDPLAPQVIDPDTGLPTGHRQQRMLPVSVESPKLEWKQWVNKRTGEVERVPDGIDPGWDTNPGQAARRQALARDFMQSVNRAPAAAGARAMSDVLPTIHDDLDKEYRGWVGSIEHGVPPEAGGRRTLGALTPPLVDALKRKTGVAAATAGITIEQTDVSRLLTQASHNPASLRWQDVYALVQHLANPTAVIWDTSQKSPALLYVFDNLQAANGQRMTIRIDMSKGRDGINAIRNISMMSNAQLKQSHMVRLDDGGSL